jgi:hypothetical protein
LVARLVQSQAQSGKQHVLTDQERAALLQQTQQAHLLQQQLLKQMPATSAAPTVSSTTVPNPSAVAVPHLPADKSQVLAVALVPSVTLPTPPLSGLWTCLYYIAHLVLLEDLFATKFMIA